MNFLVSSRNIEIRKGRGFTETIRFVENENSTCGFILEKIGSADDGCLMYINLIAVFFEIV